MLISDILYEQDQEITQAQLDALEAVLDRVFAKLGIDVEFTRHFLDRVNDERNRRQITIKELGLLFKKEFIKYGKPIAQLGPDAEAVMKDMETDINLPFALRWDANNNELDLIAKTVMRKADFKTSNKTFTVEGYKLKLERDADMMVLNITDTATGKRTEVRGKPGYETGGYDASDKLHQLLDKIGKSANISDLMNGETVGINPKHPKGASANAAATTAFNESLDNPYPFKLTGPDDERWIATANTPNGVLRMEFDGGYDDYSIDFAVGKSMGKTDAGDQFRVFATVAAMLYKWIDAVGIKHVENFDFGADKSDHASDGRARLYTRFAKKLASQLGWKLQISAPGAGNTAFFSLVNPKPVPRPDDYFEGIEENFADGKKKGKSRPGRVKRSGASCKGSVTDLRAKAKKYSGERGKMYHWCANMKAGKKK